MTPTLAAQVGANVRAEMARRRISQRALGEHLSLCQSSVSMRLRGSRPFDVQELESVALFLGVPVSALLADEVAA